MTLNFPDVSELRLLSGLDCLWAIPSQVQFSPQPSPTPASRGGDMRQDVDGPPLSLSKAGKFIVLSLEPISVLEFFVSFWWSGFF